MLLPFPALLGAPQSHLDITGPLLLLILAVSVALATRQIRVPYTVALVFAGLVLGLSDKAPGLLDVPADALIPDLIFLVLLPPLLFEGCVNIDLATLGRRSSYILLLAFLGTLLTAAIVGLAAAALLAGPLGLDPPRALLVGLLIGVIIAPTDPVSVLALFKELGVGRDLAVLVEGESVLNDGVAVVLFLILLSLLGGDSLTFTSGAAMFCYEVGGGGLLGLGIGYLTYRLLRLIDDRLIEVILSLIVAYGSYVLASLVGASGVLSVVVCGLVIGNYGTTLGMSPTTRLTLTSFWEVLAFIANSLLFLLIGIKLDAARIISHAGPILALFAVGLLGRAIVVWGFGWLLRRTAQRVPRKWLPVSWWGGVRGSIPVAMVLGLLGGSHGLTAFQVQELIAIVFGVVLLSLALQGLTIKPLLVKLGLTRRAEDERAFEVSLGRSMALDASLRELAAMHEAREIAEATYQDLKDELEAQHQRVRDDLTQMVQAHPELRQTQSERASWRLLHAQRAAVDEALHRGILSEETHHELAADIDARLQEEYGPTFSIQEESLPAPRREDDA